MSKKKIQALKTQLAVNEIFGQFRYIVIDGEIWFVAVDVAKILDLKNIRQNLVNLDDDEKGVCNVYTLGGPQEVNIVNEPGLYNLIFQSRKPEAKKFKRWVFHEVLPSIRKYGRYELPGEVKEIPMEDFLELVFKEYPNADFECTGVTMEKRDGKIVPIYHIGLTGLNE